MFWGVLYCLGTKRRYHWRLCKEAPLSYLVAQERNLHNMRSFQSQLSIYLFNCDLKKKFAKTIHICIYANSYLNQSQIYEALLRDTTYYLLLNEECIHYLSHSRALWNVSYVYLHMFIEMGLGFSIHNTYMAMKFGLYSTIECDMFWEAWKLAWLLSFESSRI